MAALRQISGTPVLGACHVRRSAWAAARDAPPTSVSIARRLCYESAVDPSVSISRARTEDIPGAAKLGAEIVRLHHRTDPERYFLLDNLEAGYAGWLEQELERRNAVVLVAKRGAAVVGYAYGAIEERDWGVLLDQHGALHDVCVAEPERRSGIARALVARLMGELEALGATLLVLRAMVQNEPARRLAESFGFRPTMLELARAATGNGAPPATS